MFSSHGGHLTNAMYHHGKIIVNRMWPILYATVFAKSIGNMMFYSLFIPCLFCVNIFDSHSFIITSFKINDNFKSSLFLFCFFLAKNEASVSPSWICHKYQICDYVIVPFFKAMYKLRHDYMIRK